jgi:death on curing protein
LDFQHLKETVTPVVGVALGEFGMPTGRCPGRGRWSNFASSRNFHAYGTDNACALAAAYARGIVRNHPFVDGNKRMAFLATYVFPRLDRFRPIANEPAAVAAMLSLAPGEMPEADFGASLRANVERPRLFFALCRS